MLAGLSCLIGACGDAAAPSTTVPPTTPVTTTVAETTTTSVAGVDVIALPVAGDTMGPAWVEELFVPYGETEDTLGTSPGGEGGSLDLGPEYGAQAPDGTWWFLDAAKTRLARFDADGRYLGSVSLPEAVLVDGIYFQFQLPRVLADGTLIAFGYRTDGTAVLRADAMGVDQVLIPTLVAPRTDDGALAYGFDETGALQAVDAVAGTVQPADWFLTQTGARFMIAIGSEGIRIQLPDAPVPVDRILPLVTAADPTIPAFASLEVTTTADGRIHLLLLGTSSADETTQLGGYTAIHPDGTVTPVEMIRNPFTLADPGSPAHLGAAFAAMEPYFMVVDVDGVRIYRPAG